MQLFCPACQAAFPGTQRCPRCGGLLLMPQEAAEAPATRPKADPVPEPAQPTPVGRVFVGAVLALGLYLGLRKLATGLVLASYPEPDGWWVSFEGLAAVCGGQVLAVIFGAVVAAAGRTGGFVFGGVVGGLCGGLFLGAELLAGAPPQDLVLYVQPAVLVFVGGAAGVFAARIWGAVPVLDMPIPDRNKLSSSRFAIEDTTTSGRPTAWLRVLAGALMMISAVAVAEQARSGAQKYSGGMLKVTSIGQGQFLTWQIAVFGVLAGGATAGAATGAGVRHGLLAGILGGAGVIGLTAAQGEALGPVAYWLSTLSLAGLPPTAPAAIVAAAGGVLLLGFLGGWLGGSLFQPLAPAHMRRRLRAGLD
ncbi:MAG: hypothetical protein J0I06_11990 [Planctomycetes bacterium]|nr:hypothetical protein [Planctomycetota bacterium]